jgi:hypothetical protein
MNNKLERVAHITSSNTWKLFATPAKVKTYLQELAYEKKLGRGLGTESNARPLTWGKFVESRVFELLGLEYSLVSTDTLQHDSIAHWSGTPDGVTKDSVIDIKCPFTMKSFCELVEIIESKSIETFKSEKPEYYWQLVSNAVLTEKTHAELIVYCPFQSELMDIRIACDNYEGADQYKLRFIAESSDDELPYIIDGGNYSNINIFKFEVPVSDMELLTNKIQSITI